MRVSEQEDMINTGSHMLLLLFRIIFVGFITVNMLGFGEIKSGIDSKELSVIFVAGGYLLGAMLFGKNRVAMYVEVVLIAAASLIFADTYLGLYVFPLIMVILSNKSVLWEIVALPLFLGVVLYVSFGINEFVIIGVFALLLILALKWRESKAKNQEMKVMKIESHVLRKELSEVEKEKIQMEIDMEGLMNMFIRMKNLNEKIKVDELLKEMIQGSVDFFQADQVALYFLDGEEYVLNQVYEKKIKVPKKFDAIDAEEILIESKYMRFPVSKNNEKWCVLLIMGKKQALINDEEENGVRYVGSSFLEDDYEQIRMFIQQVMKSISYAELLARMENMANNDYLTGIPNRRRFVEEAEMLIERGNRGADLAMILLDIDFFKKFNDTYGHDKGDEALKIVANVLEESIRGGEFIGRLGGEEFAVLVPNDNLSVYNAAERLRVIVSEVPFVRQITVSMGVSYFKKGMTFDELNKQADEALYKAKETGRNKVVEFDKMNGY